MRTRLPFALLSLLLVAACREAASPAAEYRPHEAGTVDHALCLLGFQAVALREAPTGHHLVEATINGRSGTFVLDTGANATVVARQHAGHFGIGDAPAGLSGAIGGLAGETRANQVAIDSLRIGSVEVRQDRIVTADLGQLLDMLGRLSGTTVHGLIGQDVMKEHRAIVDVARPMLYMIADDRDPAPVPAEQCRAGSSDESTAAAE